MVFTAQSLKTWQKKVHDTHEKSFLTVQIFCYKPCFFFFVFFYLIHITRWLILYILFKQSFHCLVLYNLNVILTYSFCFHFFFVYLIKPNAARIYSSVLSHNVLLSCRRHRITEFACGCVTGVSKPATRA